MSSPDFNIRPVTLDDAEQVMKLRKQVDKDKTNKNPPLDPYGGDYPSLEQQISELQWAVKNGIFLVGVSGETVVGLVSCSESDNQSGEYALIFLAGKVWRERGILIELISQVIQWAQGHSEVKSIVCRIPKSDKFAAHILKEFGFKVEKQGRVFVIQGAEYNAIDMSLKLKE